MMIAHPPVPPHSWGASHDDISMEDDELQDICDHVQLHSTHFPKEVKEEPPKKEAPAEDSSRDDDENDSLAQDQARLCAIKREAINLLSAAHKSTSGSDRIQAMTLLAALYKAETKQDLAVLGEKVQELLIKKKQNDEDRERMRAQEEANHAPERFSRIRASVRSYMSDNRSVASQPSPQKHSRQQQKQPKSLQGQKGWRFFWQRDAAATPSQPRRATHDIHGFQVPADRKARMQSLSERQKIWDTRTL